MPLQRKGLHFLSIFSEENYERGDLMEPFVEVRNVSKIFGKSPKAAIELLEQVSIKERNFERNGTNGRGQ